MLSDAHMMRIHGLSTNRVSGQIAEYCRSLGSPVLAPVFEPAASERAVLSLEGDFEATASIPIVHAINTSLVGGRLKHVPSWR